MSSMYWKSAAVAVLIAAGSVGPAQAAGRVGWVWAGDPGATAPYTPNASYSYNSIGGAITITPLDTGYYLVNFADLHATTGTDNVQVTAYDSNGYCMIAGWANIRGTVKAYVSCFDASGNPQNNFFDLLYQQRTGIFRHGHQGACIRLCKFADDGELHAGARASVQFDRRNQHHRPQRRRELHGLYSRAFACSQLGAGHGRGCEQHHAGAVQDEWLGTHRRLGHQCHRPVLRRDRRCLRSIVQPRLRGGRTVRNFVTATSTPGAWAWANNPTAKKAYPTPADFQYNGFITGSSPRRNPTSAHIPCRSQDPVTPRPMFS